MPASWRKVPLPVTESSRDENSLPVLYLHVVFVFTSLVTTACCSHRLVADVRRFFDELMTMKHRQEDRRVLNGKFVQGTDLTPRLLSTNSSRRPVGTSCRFSLQGGADPGYCIVCLMMPVDEHDWARAQTTLASRWLESEAIRR